MGDPAGIGPELCLLALEEFPPGEECDLIIYGDPAVLEQAAEALGRPSPDPTRIFEAARVPAPVQPAQVRAEYGRAAYDSLIAAIHAAQENKVDAVVTAPLNKAALHLAGIHEPGHTEILARETCTPDFAMLQYSPRLSCGFVTCHEPLSSAVAGLTPEKILRTGLLMDGALRRIHGRQPSLGMLGLNPHAGEGGLFGREEEEIIKPAVDALRTRGVDVSDPIVPDAAFMPHNINRYDGYICHYHDQGHIPFKMISLHDGVNVTMGLPIIRTSVDHGTAFDIAWRGITNPGSLFNAIRLATKLAAG